MSSETIEFFFSFRSPYSYLAAPRAFQLPENYEVDIRFRGVMPMAMRGQSVPSQKRIHTMFDTKREANRLGMPFGPVFDPIGDGAVRCLRVSELAVGQQLEKQFVLAVCLAIWAEGVDVSSDEGLRPICIAAGLDWHACLQAISDPLIEARVEKNVEDLLELGQWGVPVFRFRDQLLWGQDRIEDLERLLDAAGLRR